MDCRGWLPWIWKICRVTLCKWKIALFMEKVNPLWMETHSGMKNTIEVLSLLPNSSTSDFPFSIFTLLLRSRFWLCIWFDHLVGLNFNQMQSIYYRWNYVANCQTTLFHWRKIRIRLLGHVINFDVQPMTIL